MNYNFEWDSNKAKSNISKHKISFEDASSVLKMKMQYQFMMRNIV